MGFYNVFKCHATKCRAAASQRHIQIKGNEAMTIEQFKNRKKHKLQLDGLNFRNRRKFDQFIFVLSLVTL